MRFVNTIFPPNVISNDSALHHALRLHCPLSSYIIMSFNALSKKWKSCIGLEIHAQLTCTSKLFSNASTASILPNNSISLFDIAIPGQLPLLNKYACEQAVKAAIALNCKINQVSYFERKHYFYLDLPLGYQITQQQYPVATNGKLLYTYNDIHGSITNRINKKSILAELTVDRVQIEQDSGKSLHKSDDMYSLIDFNRAGCGLIEIVFAPELETPFQAAGVLTTLQGLLRHLSICDGNMEDGSLRCDVNVSVSPIDSTHDNGTSMIRKSNRVEIKNLNSIQRLISASTYEINRQIDLLEMNEIVHQETRGYNINTGETYRLRTKEVNVDYRFIPDPDLPALLITDTDLNRIKSEIDELPNVTTQKYLKLGLDDDRIQVLLSRQGASKYFDRVYNNLLDRFATKNGTEKSVDVNECNPLTVYHWIASELLGYLNILNSTFDDSPISRDQMTELLYLLLSNQITVAQCKMLISKLYYNSVNMQKQLENSKSSLAGSENLKDIRTEVVNGFNEPRLNLLTSDDVCPVKLAKKLGFIGHSIEYNQDSIRNLCIQCINDEKNIGNLIKYKSGNKRLSNYFLGEVMKMTKGKLKPNDLSSILIPLLDEAELK